MTVLSLFYQFSCPDLSLCPALPEQCKDFSRLSPVRRSGCLCHHYLLFLPCIRRRRSHRLRLFLGGSRHLCRQTMSLFPLSPLWILHLLLFRRFLRFCPVRTSRRFLGFLLLPCRRFRRLPSPSRPYRRCSRTLIRHRPFRVLQSRLRRSHR